jgi:threonylcarbamoyladenosine tRNA methylthiotransferase MtaB
MEVLVEAVPAARFRLTSLEATEVDDRLADLLASVPRRLAPHLHAPLQSGSDRLLRRMGRHWYTARDYASAVERLAARLPVFGLGADVIAGFPGETDDDFAETVAIAESLPFTYLHVFPYSPRPGTAATRLPDPVDPARARERSLRLRAIGERKAAAHRAGRAGTRADAIVISGGPDREALTEDYLTVTIDRALARGHRFDATLEARNSALVAS